MGKMTEEKAAELIRAALATALGRQNKQITGDTHLTESGILDSLDASVFLLELEKASRRKITDQDVEQHDLFQVSSLVAWLCK